MKKYLSLFAVATIVASSFTACLSDDDDNSSKNTPIGYISSAYVVNAGAYYSGIPGSLSKITCSYTQPTTSSTTSTPKFTSRASALSLGNTANDIMIYGEKAYIINTGDNELDVYDKNSLILLKTIDTKSLVDGTKGCQPRKLAAAGNLVYFTTFGVEDDGLGYKADSKGYVIAVDTVTFSMQKNYEVGPYPEDLVATGSSLDNYHVFVLNSDYGKGNGSISDISVVNGNGSVTTTTFENIKNPTQVEVAYNYMWILDNATYDDSYTQLTQSAVYQWGGSKTSAPTKAFEANMFAPLTSNNSNYAYLYFVKDAYSKTPTYGYYNPATGSTETLDISGIAQPCALGVNPYTGFLYVASLASFQDYSSSGYVNVYDYSTGKLLSSGLNAGVNPTAFAFDFKYIYNTASSVVGY